MVNFSFRTNSYISQFQASTGFTAKIIKYITRHTKLTWSNARSFCNSHGMDILSIADKDEETSIFDISERYFDVDTTIYIGGIATKLKDAESWYWVRSGDRIVYPIKWGPTEPNNSSPEEWCMAMKKFKQGFFMIDFTCDTTPLKFICQQETFGRE